MSLHPMFLSFSASSSARRTFPHIQLMKGAVSSDIHGTCFPSIIFLIDLACVTKFGSFKPRNILPAPAGSSPQGSASNLRDGPFLNTALSFFDSCLPWSLSSTACSTQIFREWLPCFRSSLRTVSICFTDTISLLPANCCQTRRKGHFAIMALLKDWPLENVSRHTAEFRSVMCANLIISGYIYQHSRCRAFDGMPRVVSLVGSVRLLPRQSLSKGRTLVY